MAQWCDRGCEPEVMDPRLWCPDAVPKGVQNPPAFNKCLKISEPVSLLDWHAFVLIGTRVVVLASVPVASRGWTGWKEI